MDLNRRDAVKAAVGVGAITAATAGLVIAEDDQKKGGKANLTDEERQCLEVICKNSEKIREAVQKAIKSP